MKIRRLIGAAVLATGLGLGVTGPAAATVVVGGTVAIGDPNERVAAEGELQPCIAGSFFTPCIAEGDVEVRVTLQPGRS
jgi:hypothetical protein